MIFATFLLRKEYLFMRKIYTSLFSAFILSLLFLSIPTSLDAQTPHTITGVTPKTVDPSYYQLGNRTNGIVDTIFDYFDRSTAFYELTAGTGGYTLGTNSFTEEIAVHYTSLGGPTKVTEIAVFFAKKEIMLGQADSLVARVYTADADSMPNTEIGFGKVSVADIDTAGFLTYIPVSILDSTADDFLVSINYDDENLINDTIVILSNNVLSSQGGPDGNQEKRTRQLISTGEWLRVWDIWNFSGLNMDADAMIFPIVDYNEIVGVEPALVARDLTLYRPYPNPAIRSINIPFSLRSAQRVQVVVFDANGRPVKSSPLMSKGSGEQNIALELDGLAAGSYYFLLKSDRGTLAGKFQKVQ